MFVPDRLTGRYVQLPANVAADVSDTDRAMQALNTAGVPYRGYDAIARVLPSSRLHRPRRSRGCSSTSSPTSNRTCTPRSSRPPSLAPRHVPPISLVPATRSRDYVAGLEAFRRDGEAEWATFAAATTEACQRVAGLTYGLAELEQRWRGAAGVVRAGSTVAQLLNEILPQMPLVTVTNLVRVTGRSTQAVNEAVERLHAAGVLKQTTAGRRNGAFEVIGLIDLITGFERSLASPAGDTAVGVPPTSAAAVS